MAGLLEVNMVLRINTSSLNAHSPRMDMRDFPKVMRRNLRNPMEVLVPAPSPEKEKGIDFLERVSYKQMGRLPRLHAQGTTDNFEEYENEHLEFKSLRTVVGKTANFDILARACIAFANSSGGKIVVGIEDGGVLPPEGQRCADGLRDVILKKVRERTRNVEVEIEKRHCANLDAEYILISIKPSFSVALTTDGRYFKRFADQTVPVAGDDISVLMVDRPSRSWESIVSPHARWSAADLDRWEPFDQRMKLSERVHKSVKEKTTIERMQHYRLIEGDCLTQLGILFLGTPAQMDGLGTAPVVQIRRFNHRGERVQKVVFEPEEAPHLLVETSVTALGNMCQDEFEIPHDMTRLSVQAYDRRILREIMVNALVHRPYSQAGDIYVNVHPNRLEVTNPGALPLGVTPQNILHKSERRNTVFARIFDHLGFMEREGTGIDLMYESLLTTGRTPPRIKAGDDYVTVTLWSDIVRPHVVGIMHDIDRTVKLSQRERIALALVSGEGVVTVEQFARTLSLSSLKEVDHWVENLVDMNLMEMEVIGGATALRFKG